MADLKISSYGNTNSAHGGKWDTNFNMSPDSRALALLKNAALAELGPMTMGKAAKLRGKNLYMKTAKGTLKEGLMETSIGNISSFTGSDEDKATFKEVAIRRAAINDYITYFDTKASSSRTKGNAVPQKSTLKCPLNDCSEASFQLGAQWDLKYEPSATSWDNNQFKYKDPVEFRKEIVESTTKAPGSLTPGNQKVKGSPAKPKSRPAAKTKALSKPKGRK